MFFSLFGLIGLSAISEQFQLKAESNKANLQEFARFAFGTASNQILS
jgi:hypothetical protein